MRHATAAKEIRASAAAERGAFDVLAADPEIVSTSCPSMQIAVTEKKLFSAVSMYRDGGPGDDGSNISIDEVALESSAEGYSCKQEAPDALYGLMLMTRLLTMRT